MTVGRPIVEAESLLEAERRGISPFDGLQLPPVFFMKWMTAFSLRRKSDT
jgi:hypothetical protein